MSSKMTHIWRISTCKDVLKKMQIKTTMRYHFLPTRMATIKRSDNNKCGEDV
jgi:hypothetical protein